MLPLFKPLALFLLLFVLGGYIWSFIINPHEELTDLIVPAVMWSFVAAPLWIVIHKIGTGASFSEIHIEFVGVLGRSKRYTWDDVKKIKLSSGRGNLRFIYVEFNNRNRILVSNRQIGFWYAARTVRTMSEKKQMVCDYAVGDQRGYWDCEGEEGLRRTLLV